VVEEEGARRERRKAEVRGRPSKADARQGTRRRRREGGQKQASGGSFVYVYVCGFVIELKK
jgi:hypothetical protein